MIDIIKLKTILFLLVLACVFFAFGLSPARADQIQGRFDYSSLNNKLRTPLEPAKNEAKKFSIGINYGSINNFRMFQPVSSEAGTSLFASYAYAINSFYSLGLEIGFAGDENIFNNSLNTYTESGGFFTINNIFKIKKLGPLFPYFRIATGLYSVTLWHKENQGFVFQASNTFADIGAGVGFDFAALGSKLNVDYYVPAILNFRFNSPGSNKFPSILSVGYKHEF